MLSTLYLSSNLKSHVWLEPRFFSKFDNRQTSFHAIQDYTRTADLVFPFKSMQKCLPIFSLAKFYTSNKFTEKYIATAGPHANKTRGQEQV